MKVIAGQLFLCLSGYPSVCLLLCYGPLASVCVCVCVCLLFPACIHSRTNSFFICSRGRACTLRIRNFITTTQTWTSRWSMASHCSQPKWMGLLSLSPLLSQSLCAPIWGINENAQNSFRIEIAVQRAISWNYCCYVCVVTWLAPLLQGEGLKGSGK